MVIIHRSLLFNYLGGDQGLLNAFFNDWSTGPTSRRIPFVYNLTFSASYSYLPAFARFADQVRVVHFIGLTKPWSCKRSPDGKVVPPRVSGAESLSSSDAYVRFLQQWWNLHDRYITPRARKIFTLF